MATDKDQAMKNCEAYRELISAYLDDELSAVELLELAEHIKVCAGCNRLMDELMAVSNALHRAEPFWPKQVPGEAFAGNLLEKLVREGGRMRQAAPVGPPSTRFRVGWGRAAFTALAVLILLVGGLAYYQERHQAPSASRQEAPSAPAYLIAQGTSPDGIDEFIRAHALESSRGMLLENEDMVAFVDHDQP